MPRNNPITNPGRVSIRILRNILQKTRLRASLWIHEISHPLPVGPHTARFIEFNRINDVYVGLYSILVAGVLLLHHGEPDWNTSIAISFWIAFLAANFICGYASRRTRRYFLFESIRMLLPLPLYGALSLAHLPKKNPAIATHGRIAHLLGTYGFLFLMGTLILRIMGFLIERSRQILEEKELFEQITENISEVFWVITPDRKRSLYISRAYETIFGRSRSAHYANVDDWLIPIHPSDRERVKKAAKGSSPEFDVEYRIVRPDGSVRHIRDRSFAINDAKGEVQKIVGIAEDVTELKLAAARLEEQRMALVHSAKMSSLGEMAAGIAHEINNPLTIIQGRIHQILRISQDPKPDLNRLHDLAVRIDATVQRIGGIIRGLRAFAKDDANAPIENIKLTKLISDTLDFCEARFRNHGIELRVGTVAPELSVECRPIQISQVLLNLLNNASDATENRPTRWVSIDARGDGNDVNLEIGDSGAGISPDIREKIFLPFFTTKESGRGTGLGLSISKGIVENHGGSLKLDESAEHTLFRITLPKYNRQGSPVAGKAPAESSSKL